MAETATVPGGLGEDREAALSPRASAVRLRTRERTARGAESGAEALGRGGAAAGCMGS